MIDYLIEETDCIVDHVDFMGETALIKSMQCNNNETAVKLITAGASINKATNSLLTPLHEAVRMKKRDIAQLFIKKGADINAVEAMDNSTPLHVAVEEGNYEMVCMLLYYGADASIRNSCGLSPFMFAVSLDAKPEIQELLFKYEADVNMQDCDGFSTLLLAMNWQNPLVLELIDRGADIYHRNSRANVVNFLFAYEDNSIFERVWPLITLDLLNQVETDMNLLFEVQITDDDWRRRIETILFCEKGEALVQKHSNILSYLIPKCHGHKLKECELFPLVCTCLMYGAEATYNEVLQIYRLYGYNGILRLLLHMGITVNRSNEDLVLPYFICYVAPYSRGYDSNCSMCIRIQNRKKECDNLLKHLTFVFTLCASCRNFYTDNRGHVTSLKELSRLATRRAIALRFNTRSTLMFYTIVNHLNVPNIIKKLISYEVPIV